MEEMAERLLSLKIQKVLRMHRQQNTTNCSRKTCEKQRSVVECDTIKQLPIFKQVIVGVFQEWTLNEGCVRGMEPHLQRLVRGHLGRLRVLRIRLEIKKAAATGAENFPGI